MHHTNRHDVITTDDIQDVKHVHITEEDGQKVAHIKAVLDPRKNYHESNEVYLHTTNGINHHTYGPFEHAKPAHSTLLDYDPDNLPVLDGDAHKLTVEEKLQEEQSESPSTEENAVSDEISKTATATKGKKGH